MSLIEIGDEKGLTERIVSDLPNHMGPAFEEMVREILIGLNLEEKLPFKFTNIGSYWNRRGDVKIDIVAINEDESKILFGECKLKASKITAQVLKRLKSKAEAVPWKNGRRDEYYALFSANEVKPATREMLERERVMIYSLRQLL